MAQDLYPTAARLVFNIEGPDSDDPHDPGGLTRFGIALNKHPELTRAQLLAFTRDDALAFIRKKYWDAHRCGEMPWRWALGVFDGEVNQGSVIDLAQQALSVRADGVVGSLTIAAMELANSEEDYRLFLALRLVRYASSRDAATYEKGWFKRVVLVAQLSEDQPVGVAHT